MRLCRNCKFASQDSAGVLYCTLTCVDVYLNNDCDDFETWGGSGMESYFDYRNGKIIADDTTYFPEIVEINGELKVGYYGHSNIGKFLMITGEFEDFLRYSDGVSILTDMYNKAVNKELVENLKKCFYNNEEFSFLPVTDKYECVEKLIDPSMIELYDKKYLTIILVNYLKTHYECYLVDKDKYELFGELFRLGIDNEKAVAKNKEIFEKIIDCAGEKYNLSGNSLFGMIYKDDFYNIIKGYIKFKV